MLLDNLKKMSADELRAFAGTQGVKVHWNAKPDTIIKAIMDKVASPVKTPENAVDTRIAATKDPVFNTREEVEAMLAPIRERAPGFESIYNDEDRTVTFSYKGAVDCHNPSVPLYWLKEKAKIVSRGRIAPLGRPEFESMNTATGKNAYTNTVLAG